MCNNLIKNGAILTTCADDILDYYGIEKKQKPTVELSNAEKEVYEIIRKEEIHIDKLVFLSGKKAFELMPILTMLEMKKLIVKNAGNIFSAI